MGSTDLLESGSEKETNFNNLLPILDLNKIRTLAIKIWIELDVVDSWHIPAPIIWSHSCQFRGNQNYVERT